MGNVTATVAAEMDSNFRRPDAYSHVSGRSFSGFIHPCLEGIYFLLLNND